jgi:hypothetical protein
MFQWLELDWETPSGIRLQVERYQDWILYNEIFVNGDYDEAIQRALNHAQGEPLHIVDLGANVGYFTLRAFDRLLERGLARNQMTVTAVEGHAASAAGYRDRVISRNGLGPCVRLITGLAGRRTGSGSLCTDLASAADQLPRDQVPYVDLTLALGSAGIDLLKCDIEGDEEDLLGSYPELFQKTRVAVFEFHSQRCNVERCKALLSEYGFTNTAIRRPESDYPLFTAWR